MTGVTLELVGGTTRVDKKVTCTLRERVIQRFPSVSQPRFMLMDAVSELMSLCMVWIVEYIDSPSIGGIVSFLKLLTILSMEVSALVGGRRTNSQMTIIRQ